jgi:hypothetical protein
MSSLPLRWIVQAPADVPCEVFRAVAAHVQRSLGWPSTLRVVDAGGTPDASHHAFSGGEADVGLLCADRSVRSSALLAPGAELLPIAPVFRSARDADAFPLQAVVVRVGLPPSLVDELVRVFLSLHEHPGLRRALAASGIVRFVPLDSSGPAWAIRGASAVRVA